MNTSDDFNLERPITQQRAEKATQWIIDSVGEIALAKANRDKADHMLKVTKAVAMKASGANSAAAQEREALASDAYQSAIDRVWDCTVKYETILGRRQAATALIDVWRSINSNLKGARV